MIKLFYKTKLKSAGYESILINLFSKWILFIYPKIRVCEVFLIKLYFKATVEEGYFPVLGELEFHTNFTRIQVLKITGT